MIIGVRDSLPNQYPCEVGPTGSISGAGAGPGRLKDEQRQVFAHLGKSRNQGHSGWGGEFARAAGEDLPPSRQLDDRRDRHTELTVRIVDSSGPDSDRARTDGVDLQRV